MIRTPAEILDELLDIVEQVVEYPLDRQPNTILIPLDDLLRLTAPRVKTGRGGRRKRARRAALVRRTPSLDALLHLPPPALPWRAHFKEDKP